MIRKLFILNLKALGSNFVRGGKKKPGAGKILLVTFVALYVAATLIGMFSALFHSLLEPFFSAGIGWMYFALLALIVFGMCVISTIFTASAQLFGAKDNELLLSMPIKPSAILISRLLVIIAFEYVFAVIAALPAFVIWLTGGYATVGGILFLATGIFLLPLMALAVALALAWLLGAVTLRLRHKNIIILALSVGFSLAYFYLFSNIQGYLGELVSKGAELAEAFRRVLPPFYAFGMGITGSGAGSKITFVLWATLPFAAAVILLSTNYRKMLIANRGNVKVVYKEKTAKAGSALSALVRKELAHYWSKPFVILNSSIGSLFMLALSAMVIVKRSDILLYADEIAPTLGNLPPAALATIFPVFLCTVNNISASLISLEGKNLWIAKSIPVPPKEIILSKVCTHLLISGLPCLAASVCAATVFAGNVSDWLIIVALPQTVGALIAVGGLAINLHFPILEWTNEIYVVKRGLSAMITMFGAMGALAGLGFAYAFLLSATVPLTAFLWICAVAFAIAATIIYAWLMKTGAKKIAEL
ncbi:ABC transporter permease [Clostridia bacterium]|nr:ABC transporter permease [Clostridia bacterium]